MSKIVQPVTVTDMRRDPKSLLERVKKEKVVPILNHSEFPAAVIAIEELNRLYEAIKELKHELFVQETLEAEREIERGEGSGPFTLEEFEEHLNQLATSDE